MIMQRLFLYSLGLGSLTIARGQEGTGCFNYYLASGPSREIQPSKSQEKPFLVPRDVLAPRPNAHRLLSRGMEQPKANSKFTETRENYYESQPGGNLKYVETAFMIEEHVESKRRVKRFDTTGKVNFLASGNGTCGPYDSEKELGACLWSGVEGDSQDVSKTGWFTNTLRGNCGKTLFVQRAGRPETLIFVKVLDACAFPIPDHHTGCAQIFLTKKAFDQMKPTPEESAKGAVTDLVWDFNTQANMAT